VDVTEAAEPSSADRAEKKYLTVRQAAFIGVGAMVGTTLIHEPASIVTLAGILVLSVSLDYGWKRCRPSTPVPVQAGP
jgi:hypothetical protein